MLLISSFFFVVQTQTQTQNRKIRFGLTIDRKKRMLFCTKNHNEFKKLTFCHINLTFYYSWLSKDKFEIVVVCLKMYVYYCRQQMTYPCG